MSDLEIEVEDAPFPDWMGPYSPARGMQHGLRFHGGELGVWSNTPTGKEFWTVQRNGSVDRLVRSVMQTWGGGRLLFLPNGYIIKPLPGADERGKRVFVGSFEGSVVLVDSDGMEFDLSSPSNQKPGGIWNGPTTLGLECAFEADGSLRCDWNHPDEYGGTEVSHHIVGGNAGRVRSFRVARPGESTGRVHISANGMVTTNCKVGSGWQTRFVCYVDPDSLDDWSHWLE